MKKLSIVEEKLVHYRVPLFQQMHARLRDSGIEMTVYAQPQGVNGSFPWFRPIRNITWPDPPGDRYLAYQPCLKDILGSDLIVVGQENKFLLNYLLLLMRPLPRALGGSRLAFWGHGRNFQSEDTQTLRERVKRAYSNHCDWWFAYNDLSQSVLVANGYPAERITSVQNTIDTVELQAQFDQVSDAAVQQLRADLGLGDGPVGLFCGSMYGFKMLPFIVDAARIIQARIPGFKMLFVGDGVDSTVVREAAARHDFIHFVGARYGAARLPYFKVADCAMMPGAVGLGIIDSFVTGVPLFTTSNPSHGPEIVYLDDGVNGLMTPDDLPVYAARVGDYLEDRDKLDALKAGSRRSARHYTIENMAARFCEGIGQVLALR